MTAIGKGDRVHCIDDDWYDPEFGYPPNAGPRRGEIYMVSGAGGDRQDVFPEGWIMLYEFFKIIWDARCFVPIEDIETDISELQKIVADVFNKEPVG